MRERGLSRNAAITSEGLRVGFRTNREDLLKKFHRLRISGGTPTDWAELDFVYSLEESRRKFYTAYLGSRALIQDADLETALDFIHSDLQHTIASHSREHLFVHAGAIGWRGRAIILPGRSYCGKSTLVQALIRAGAVYFSDEFARIDGCGLVHPFVRPLSFRSPKGKVVLHPEKEKLKIASDPCPLGAIIATRYTAEGAWCPEHLSPGQAALELLSNTVAVRLDPAKAVRYIGKLASSACAVSSPRGEAETTAPRLLETLDTLLG